MTTQEWLSNRWVRRVGYVVAGIAALWAVSWLAVPPLLKSQLSRLASERLGRAVTIGAVDFQPWTLELTLRDVVVAGAAPGGPPQASIGRVYLDGELQSLLRLAPVVDAVEVDAPVLRLVHRGAGHFDVDDILARLARPASEPAGEPARFALYNLRVSGGAFDFTDEAVGRTQQVRDLKLTVPFLSSIASQREVKVEPHLAFKLNGSAFDSAAAATPFARTGKGDATLRFSAFDLRPWLGYLPAGLPARPQSAVLDADVRVAFEQSPRLAVKLSGWVAASGVKLADAQGGDLLAFDRLRVDMDDVRPLERQARIARVALDGPKLELARDASGRLNLAPAGTPEARTGASAPVAAAPASRPTAGPARQEAPGWNATVARVEVRGGSLRWRDATTRPQAQVLLRDLGVDASGLQWPMAQPAPFEVTASLDAKEPARLKLSGTGSDKAATATLVIEALPLAVGQPYAAAFLQPRLTGSLAGEVGMAWRAPEPGQPIQLVADVRRLTLDKPALAEGARTVAGAQSVRIEQARVDVGRRQVEVGRLAVERPRVEVERDADGRWMYERWLAAPAQARTETSSAKAGEADAGWSVTLADAAINGGAAHVEDKAMGRPVSLEFTGLQVQAKNFSPAASRPSPFAVALKVGAGQAEAGRFSFKGSAAMAPLALQGQVDAADLPLHALEPYFGEKLNIELLRADASFKGSLRFAQARSGLTLRLAGDTAIEDFRANSVPVRQARGARTLQGAEELLSWRALALRGLELNLAPGAAPRVDVRETSLSDFFARIVVNENGRINLQDVVKSSVPAGTSSTIVATATVASAAAAASPAASAQGAREGSSDGPPPVISFGPVRLVNGKVFFSDRFVKPNYSADLSELNGSLSAFSSQPSQGGQGTPQMADLELRGRAEGTASLEVLGKINPLAKPLALDIKGKVRDLELPPLSPYSVKYAGHGIERGKLSMDVAYVVQPDGRLTASNRLVLNQLSFGEAVPGAPASLPVKLAVALLADRNGMIDLDLPISGSLNDPQFSLAPVIFKIIVNIVTKAITAPFSLLASAFGGGGDQMNIVQFSPGSAALDEDAKNGLDRVAKALADRPALRMTVVGTASLDSERDAYRRERLGQLVRAEKRREVIVAGGTATAEITVSPAEYPALLKEVYRRADIRKPRNVIGMAKDLPPSEMEALLLASVAVTEDMMRELAVQRGVAVRDYLAARKLPPERLFLGAAKAIAPEAKWSPRAELSLSSQ